jgi:exopolysaccharide biosynthesis polyprenyl glycosylphosphotransferase
MIRIFRVSIPTSVLVLLVSEFLLALGLLLLVAWVVFAEELELFIFYENGMLRLAIVAITLIFSFYFQNLYNDFRPHGRALLLQSAFVALGVSLLVQSTIAYLTPGWIAPRLALLVGGTAFCIVFPFWRIAFVRFFMPVLGTQWVLFLGANSLARDIARSMSVRPELAMRGIGFVDDEHEVGAELEGLRVLGPLSNFAAVVDSTKPDCVVVGMSERRQKLPLEDLLRLRLAGVRIEEAATTFQTAFGRVPTRTLRHSQLIFSSELGPLPRNLRLQAFYSVLFGLVGLAVAAPIMVLVALAVRLTSPGPILFRQVRIGMGGKPFTVFKFRSMVVDAEAKTGAVWASRNDPRVTAIGGLLRKTRLDELPQLFNVLRRDMSIVGPRPERPEFVHTLSEIIPFYAHRHSVKPGITGWAQINYKYGDTIDDAVMKLEYDMYYIKNISPSLDLYIMFHTVKAMLASGTGQ